MGFALTAQQTAFATNEGSYRMGLKYGHGEYHQCYTGHNCDTSENYYTPECEDGGIDVPRGSLADQHHVVDNKTACEDGYTHGWIQECLIDGGGASCKPQADPTNYTQAKCIATGHYWDGFQCERSAPVAITGPGECHKDPNTGWTCEAGIGKVGGN